MILIIYVINKNTKQNETIDEHEREYVKRRARLIINIETRNCLYMLDKSM